MFTLFAQCFMSHYRIVDRLLAAKRLHIFLVITIRTNFCLNAMSEI